MTTKVPPKLAQALDAIAQRMRVNRSEVLYRVLASRYGHEPYLTRVATTARALSLTGPPFSPEE